MGWGKKTQTLLMAAVLLPAISIAGPHDDCDEQQVARDASRLENVARTFEDAVDKLGNRDGVERLAHDLHDAADKLVSAARHGRCHQLRQDFRFVADAYNKLATRVGIHRDARLIAHFRSVQFAYKELTESFSSRPRFETASLYCASENMREKSCVVPGKITSVTLTAQRSAIRCVQGRNWDFNALAITVKHGCRADFAVTYQR